jgi:hypothetical protein
MKQLAIVCFVLLTAAATMRADDPPATTTTAPATPAPQRDSALVRASKTGAGRPKSTRKVITNADVKKSKGKLIPAASKTPAPESSIRKNLLDEQAEQRRNREQADALVLAAQKKVADLEKELRRIEQSFYDSNDPMYRDDVIQKSFGQTRRQLDDARKELADARDLQGKAEPPN